MAKPTPNRCGLCLGRCVQHVFNKDAISGGRIVHKDMGDGADEFAVLDDWTS